MIFEVEHKEAGGLTMVITWALIAWVLCEFWSMVWSFV